MGERLTWDEMVQRYPEQWVVVKDVDLNGSGIASGILVAVKSLEQNI